MLSAVPYSTFVNSPRTGGRGGTPDHIKNAGKSQVNVVNTPTLRGQKGAMLHDPEPKTAHPKANSTQVDHKVTTIASQRPPVKLFSNCTRLSPRSASQRMPTTS